MVSRKPTRYSNDPVREVLREFEEMTGHKVRVNKIDEKFFGLLPDDPQTDTRTVEERGMEIIHELNNKASRLVIRRRYFPNAKGFAFLLLRANLHRPLMDLMRKHGLEQTGGPTRDEEGGQLVWVRDAKTKMEFVSPHSNFHSLCEHVTRSGKYQFESLDDLRSFIIDRAFRTGMEGTRLELETALVDFLSSSPPPRDIFSKMDVGSDEQMVVEGKLR